MKKYLYRLLYLPLVAIAGFSLIACTSNIGGVPASQEKPDSSATTAVATATVEPPTVTPSPTPVQITGSVVDSRTGDPLPAAIYLSAGQKASSQTTSITTDDGGHFQAIDLEFPLAVRVELPGYQLWENTFDALEDLAGNPSYALDIALAPTVTGGTLYDAGTNAPLPGVAIMVDSENHPQAVSTDDSGAFELYSLLPNDRITVEAPDGYLPFEMPFSDEPELTLALQPRQVAVTVGDGFIGSPVAGGEVAFNQTLTDTTNAAGEAVFTHIPASGQISVSMSGYVTATVDYEDSQAVEIALMPSALQGVIRAMDTGQALSQTAVYLGDTFFRTDDNGHFMLETLPVTPTRLMIKAAGYHRTYAQLAQTGIITAYDPAPMSGVEGRWLAAAPCAQLPQPGGPPCLDFALETFEAKAIYVPLHKMGSRKRMIEYLDFIAANELNAIVVDVKGDFGFIAWDSQVELVSEIGADEWFKDTWIPLDEFVAEAKARNIYTIARLVVFKDNPLAHGKPELAAVMEDGAVWIDGEELGWANPFREEVWDYNIALAQEVAAFGFDELNFDYIRFPSDGDVGAIVYEEEVSLETRTAAIRQFMTRLSEGLRPYGVFVSADVFGLTIWVRPDSDMRIGQRIIDVAPHIDYLAPMVYPSTFIPGNLGYDNPSAEPYGIVYRSQKEAEKLVPPYVKVRPWLQGYWYSLEEMQWLKQGAIDAEATGWSWWNAGGKYDSALFEPVEEE